jgi:hypothetical protein
MLTYHQKFQYQVINKKNEGGQEIRKGGKLGVGIVQLKLKGVQNRTIEKFGRSKVQLSLIKTLLII